MIPKADMPKRHQKRAHREKTNLDELLDQLLDGYCGPQYMIGQVGMLNGPNSWLVERSLHAELTNHLSEVIGEHTARSRQ